MLAQQLAAKWRLEGLCAAQMGATLWLTWAVAVTVVALAMQQLDGGFLMLPFLQSGNTGCSSSCHREQPSDARVCQHLYEQLVPRGPLLWFSQ